MYQYHQVLTGMCLGESDRAIARSGLMGREKTSALREVAGREGWLETSGALPDGATLAQVLQVPTSRASIRPLRSSLTRTRSRPGGVRLSEVRGHPPSFGGHLRVCRLVFFRAAFSP